VPRKYYHAQGSKLVRDFYQLGGAHTYQFIAACVDDTVAGKIAAKLNAADDFEYALGVMTEHGNKYAKKLLEEVGKREPNHY
jgi:hypothetical protein